MYTSADGTVEVDDRIAEYGNFGKRERRDPNGILK
jgi:hypothetical protein